MPALQTHYWFADSLFPLDMPYRQAALVGAQGPDPFFLAGVLPFSFRGIRVWKVGQALHRKEIATYYAAFWSEAKKSKNPALALAFFKGLLAHYALDRACHPYVYSWTGFSSRYGGKRVPHHSANHAKLEMAIDEIVAEENGHFSFVPEYALALPNDQLQELSRLFELANQQVRLGKMTADSYAWGVRCYRRVERFLNSPHGLKRGLFRLFGKNFILYAMSYPSSLQKTYGEVDWLNRQHRPWLDPSSGEERYESWDDLEREAFQDYQEISRALENEKDVFTSLENWCEGKNHNGFRQGQNMVHYQPLFS
ncbi:MAG: zinc dependent phospholipase C family protein [Erysipelotrichaceae bacterium]|nr:zinc dependent phospholipase C family protein [Erysipelotrichaceae bacterium]